MGTQEPANEAPWGESRLVAPAEGPSVGHAGQHGPGRRWPRWNAH
jgi:hypothetical protein